jgi:hypothetical protein
MYGEHFSSHTVHLKLVEYFTSFADVHNVGTGKFN